MTFSVLGHVPKYPMGHFYYRVAVTVMNSFCLFSGNLASGETRMKYADAYIHDFDDGRMAFSIKFS
jgi:hypothetical protein